MIHLNSMNVYYTISTKHWILVINTLKKSNNIYTKRFQWHTNTYVGQKLKKNQGRIQDFKLGRGGGGLKIIAPSGSRRETFWVISCEKSRLYAKKKIIFLPILGGRVRRVRPSWIHPCKYIFFYIHCIFIYLMWSWKRGWGSALNIFSIFYTHHRIPLNIYDDN